MLLTDVGDCSTDAMYCSSRNANASQPSMELEGTVKVNDVSEPCGPVEYTAAYKGL